MTQRVGAGNWDLSRVESDTRPTARPRGSKGLRKQEGASEGNHPLSLRHPTLAPGFSGGPSPVPIVTPGCIPPSTPPHCPTLSVRKKVPPGRGWGEHKHGPQMG